MRRIGSAASNQASPGQAMATTLIEELAIWDVELEQLTSAGDIAFR